MGKSSAPATPDYKQLAMQQGQINKDTAAFNQKLNQVNQVGPYGSFTYSRVPGQVTTPGQAAVPASGMPQFVGMPSGENGNSDTARQYYNSPADGNGPPPQFAHMMDSFNPGTPAVAEVRDPDQSTLTMNLAPEQQQLFDATNRAKLGLAGNTPTGNPIVDRLIAQNQKGLDLTGAGPQVRNVAAGEDARKAMVDAVYNQFTSQLDPRYAQDERRTSNALIQQGLTEGSQPFMTQMENFRRSRDAAYQQAQNAAVVQGDASQNQAFQQGLQNANLSNQQRDQAVRELIGQYGQNQGDYANYMNQIAPTLPQQMNTGATFGAQGSDLMGASQQQYQADLNRVNQENANSSGLWGGLIGLGGTLLGMPGVGGMLGLGAGAGGAADVTSMLF